MPVDVQVASTSMGNALLSLLLLHIYIAFVPHSEVLRHILMFAWLLHVWFLLWSYWRTTMLCPCLSDPSNMRNLVLFQSVWMSAAQVNHWCESGIYLLASQAVDKCQSQDGAESALTDIDHFLGSAEKNQLTELRNLHNQYEVVLSENIKVWFTKKNLCTQDHCLFCWNMEDEDWQFFTYRPVSWRLWSGWRMSKRCLRSGKWVWSGCQQNRRGPSSLSPHVQSRLLNAPQQRPRGPRLRGASSVSPVLLVNDWADAMWPGVTGLTH